MKKLFSLAMTAAVILSLMVTSVAVHAKDGDVIVNYEGKTLTDKDNGADKGGVRNKEKGTIELGKEDMGEGHVIWGYEPPTIDTNGGKLVMTIIVKCKIVEAGDDTDDNVLRLDPKVRVKASKTSTETTAEPPEVGPYYTGEDLAALKPDKDGFVYLYGLLDPESYEENDFISVENRIHFNSVFGWQIDVYGLKMVEGNAVPEEPTPTPGANTTPPATTATKAPTPAPTTSAPTTTAPATSTPAPASDSSFPVVPVVIGVVAAAAIIGGIIYYLAKKRR